MAKPIYLTDPVVAAHYGVHPGEWANVADDNEADWLVDQHHGWPMDFPRPVPAPYYVDPAAPLPFAPYDPQPSPAPAPTPARAPAPAPAPQAAAPAGETAPGEPSSTEAPPPGPDEAPRKTLTRRRS
jgi:hypothetical protein